MPLFFSGEFGGKLRFSVFPCFVCGVVGLPGCLSSIRSCQYHPDQNQDVHTTVEFSLWLPLMQIGYGSKSSGNCNSSQSSALVVKYVPYKAQAKMQTLLRSGWSWLVNRRCRRGSISLQRQHILFGGNGLLAPLLEPCSSS